LSYSDACEALIFSKTSEILPETPCRLRNFGGRFIGSNIGFERASFSIAALAPLSMQTLNDFDSDSTFDSTLDITGARCIGNQ
jgi:hypothetical protein